MKKDKRNYKDAEITQTVDRFKRSIISGSTMYFDVSEFEFIVEHLLEEGDLRASEIAVKQGIRIHPGAIPLHLKYAQVLINKGNYEKSLKHLHYAEKVEANNPDVHILKGSARMVMGNEPDALLSFNEAMKHADSEIDEIYYQIGTSYVQIGQIRKAIYYFEKTARANSSNKMALHDVGFFCDQLGDYEKSIKYYNKYLDMDPFNQAAWFNLGNVYNKSNKHRKAIEAYEFALTLDDGFHMALFNIGNALANDEQFEKAIEKYLEFLEKEPFNENALCYIGECYLNLEQYDHAIFFFQKVLEINGENDSALFGIGLILWAEKEYDDSIDFISKAISIDDRNAEYWLTLGKVFHDYEIMDCAIDAFKEAARIDADNIEVWLNWSELLKNIDEQYNAIRILKLGIKNNSNSLLKYHLVAYLLESNNKEVALNWLYIAMEQEADQINYLFDICPEAKKCDRVKKLVEDFQSNKVTG